MIDQPESGTIEGSEAEEPELSTDHRFCRHIRTKKMFYGWDVISSQDRILASNTHQNFWCQWTMTDTGPDDLYVEHARCRPGRGCYEPMSAE